MRRTKIVATIGPSSRRPEMLRQLILAGMDVARLNFSHGTHGEHRATASDVRKVAAELGKNVAIMADLQGPKIRTGPLQNDEPVLLVNGESICLTTRQVMGDATCVSTTYEHLPQDVRPGDSIFIADGMLQLIVQSVDGPDVHCRIEHGGYLGEHKGINLPGVSVSAPALTAKDIQDLEVALDIGVDFVALSFVRSASDIERLRSRIRTTGRFISIVAKIERPEAVAHFSEILEVTDAVMLARGDLGVEVPLNKVPQIQKKLIHDCNDLGIPVITATQMLESMTNSIRPTRAEVADVANAIYDGTDALMLSGETASGLFPIQAVRVMADVAAETDQAMAKAPTFDRITRMRQSAIPRGKGAFGNAIGQAACRTAESIGAKCIVSLTKTSYTAGLVSRYRPSVPVYAITVNEEASRRCAVIWGVEALRSIEPCSTDALDGIIDSILLEAGLAQNGDPVVIAGGMPLAMQTRTNMLKIHTVGGETSGADLP